jgi:Membrane carboxypeptidase (penicillin-binding protein)
LANKTPKQKIVYTKNRNQNKKSIPSNEVTSETKFDNTNNIDSANVDNTKIITEDNNVALFSKVKKIFQIFWHETDLEMINNETDNITIENKELLTKQANRVDPPRLISENVSLLTKFRATFNTFWYETDLEKIASNSSDNNNDSTISLSTKLATAWETFWYETDLESNEPIKHLTNIEVLMNEYEREYFFPATTENEIDTTDDFDEDEYLIQPQKKKNLFFEILSILFFGLLKTLWSLACLIFILVFAGSLFVADLAYPIYLDWQSTLPDLSIETITSKMKESTMVYDAYDNPVAPLAEEAYVPVDYEDLPENLIDAVTAAEDSRFFLHLGVDGPRTVSAVINNSILGRVTSGGSTITQQLIKLTSLKEKINAEGSDYKESEERKMHEWILAYRLEQIMPKEDILVAYLNSIGYGRHIGVGTAAKRFFNKSVSQLTLIESILLAGIPQSSSTNYPYTNMEPATERYQQVIEYMVLHDYITEEQATAIRHVPLADILLTNQNDFINKNQAYYSGIEYELNAIFNLNAANNEDEFIELLPYYTGYKIYTALDVEQQAMADWIMNSNDVVNYSEMLQNIPYYWNNNIYSDDNLQAAFTVVNTRDGGIPAIGAARNFNGNNFALHGYRSPGSSIKPVIDYAPAMEKLGWDEHKTLEDKITFYSGSTSQVYNFTNTYSNQQVSLNSAIAQSLNTIAVQAMQQVGVEYAGNFANSLGISKAGEYLADNNLYESAALGGGLETTTTQMAGAYAAFGNAGRYNTPHFIRRIENEHGEIIYEYKPENLQVMSARTATNITDALIYTRRYGTSSGGGRAYIPYDITFASKTGTSSYGTADRRLYNLSDRAEKDHWYVGYTPDYSIAVWTGFNQEDGEFLYRTGGNVNANKSYGSYIAAAWLERFAPRYTYFDFNIPENNDVVISAIALQLDEIKKNITWNRPKVSYPTNIIENFEADSYGSLVYDIFIISDGDETLVAEGLPADNLSFNYADYLKGEETRIRVVARLSNNYHNVSTSNRTILIH